MHVLAVTNMLPTESSPTAGTFVASQIESLRRRGFVVDVLHVDRTHEGRSVYRSLARRVRGSLAETPYALVHVMYGGVMADIVTRVTTRPVLVSFCGSDLLGDGGGSLATRLSTAYGVRASRKAARRADGIVVKSANLLAALPDEIDEQRTWVLPNGVELDRFRPLDRTECLATLGWSAERKHVLFPSSPARPEKRFELARSACTRLEHDRGGVELQVLDGVAPDDVPIWLNAADVLLLTSTHEGSPNVVKEALACGLPVVSVDVGDVRERIEGVSGCYLADASAEDIAAKAARALAHGRVDATSRLRALSADSVADRLGAIYDELAASSTP